jgi:SAM-dependent methyltransferase
MNFFDLANISERYMELINPSTPEKVLTIGKFLRLKEGTRVIDFGCGYGEVLALWAERFGISGIGIDVREHACNRARKKMCERGFAERIEIVCANAAEYQFEKHAFDVATCIGAPFIWGGYRLTIRTMRDAIHGNGKLVMGESYWLKEHVPPGYAQEGQRVHTEYELLQIAREEGFDFEYMVRASHDDWDTYKADNWYGLVRWIEENPKHPERQEVIDHLHKIQDEYLGYGREYMGWAMYILNSIRY